MNEPDGWEQIDRVCDEFEANWSEGQAPRIERYLERVAEPLRRDLTVELLLVELESIAREGRQPERDNYLSRLPADLVEDAFSRMAAHRGDADPLLLEALKSCWLIVVNEQEAAFLAGQVGGPADAAGLAAKLGVGVLRTLGHAGSEASVDGVAHRVGAHQVKAIDTTAAGDCFVGVLAAALDRGLDLPAAMQRASVAAALACTKRGSQGSLPDAAEIDAAMAGV